jgi:hypothetical protein
MKKKFLLICLVCTAFSIKAETLSFRCTYTAAEDVDFDKGYPVLSNGKPLSEGVFDSINLDKGTGRLIGNGGASDVHTFRGDGAINILERTGTGNMNLTTIFISKNPAFKGKFPVVQSRHVNLPNGPVISQHLGLCTLLP